MIGSIHLVSKQYGTTIDEYFSQNYIITDRFKIDRTLARNAAPITIPLDREPKATAPLTLPTRTKGCKLQIPESNVHIGPYVSINEYRVEGYRYIPAFLSSFQRMAMDQVVSPFPRFMDGCTEMKSGRRKELQICSGCSKKYKRSRNSRRRFRRDPFHFAVILSITTLMLSCRTIKEVPMLVNAFVQHTNGRPYSAQRNIIAQKQEHIRQLPSLPHRQSSPLSAKKESDENEEKGSFGFFNRKDKDDEPKEDKEEDGKSELPFVGRFFATEEEKEEKRRIKQAEAEAKERLKLRAKKEKEQLKLEAKKERLRREKESNKDSKADDEEKESVVTGVKNYFRERQIRKDAETLRLQVRRKEELRQIQLERDAEELRLAVQQREKDRREKLLKLKVPTAPVVAISSETPAEDIVRKKIQSQKELDQARKERLEQIREVRKENAKQKQTQQPPAKTTEKKAETKSDSSASKSQRLGGVVSAAQKFVSGVFDGKAEQWIVVCPKTRISPGEILPVTAAGIDLLLVASKDGSALHCVANSCPHLGTPLEVGSLARLPIESKNTPPQQQGNNKVQPKEQKEPPSFGEIDIANMLKQDGCEDCIVCPLHKTAFALESGEVRGEWCPYPPVIGKLTGAIKTEANLPVFDVRIKGRNIEVRLNTPVEINDASSAQKR